MGKNKANSNLGKAVIKDRFKKIKRPVGDATVHTTDLDDGYEWARLNLQSITERSTLDDFLATAEMAGTEFTAERRNIQIVQANTSEPLLTFEERKAILLSHEVHRALLKIPRRPKWDESTTATELDLAERESFLDWRKKLAELQDMEGVIMTPFEKNLDFWRQLWRVIERSDVIAQIVDARNPLLFRCSDLDDYVKEVNVNKKTALLVNKADHLTHEQRVLWGEYFDNLNVRALFWSAVAETDRLDAEKRDLRILEQEEEDRINSNQVLKDQNEKEQEDNLNKAEEENSNKTEEEKDREELEKIMAKAAIVETEPEEELVEYVLPEKNCPKLLTGVELVSAFKSLYRRKKGEVTTIGLVGYPNVGKSSTINAILQSKKCPVSATPGRTKHFQTLYVDEELMLCDCPGLVMPSFVATKAEMVCNGILPIDQMRDAIPPIAHVCETIGRDLLESCYGFLMVKPGEGEDQDRNPTPYELLSSYASMRGFMTHKGIPDYPRAARLILKDYVNVSRASGQLQGKLLYLYPVPGADVELFKATSTVDKQHKMALMSIGTKGKYLSGKSIDQAFFDNRNLISIGSKGITGGDRQYTWLQAQEVPKGEPIKVDKRHNNRGKRQKLRRQYGHLDA